MTDDANTTRDAYLPGLSAPAAAPDGLDAPFWNGARAHRLMVQRCGGCEHYQMPAEWICHRCHSFDVEWHEVPPTGVVYSWMRVHNASHPAIADHVPYLVVVVELPDADHVKVLGNLLGDAAQDVAIGEAVEAVFEDHEDYTLIQWRRTVR